MRILTFNHHESYIALLAQTGFDFDVVIRRKHLDLSWQQDRVSLPANCQLIDYDHTLVERLKTGYYDVVICHTIKNLIWMLPFFRNRFVFIAHIPLYYYTWAHAIKSLAKRFILKLFMATHRCRFVAIAQLKLETWRQSGSIIHPTVGPFPLVRDGEGYDKIAVVCNHLAQRDEELGWPTICSLLRDLPITIIGLNPGIAQSIRLSSYPEFQEYLRGFRIYLYTIRQPYGDGFNLGLLEAMSMGMAPVTIDNPSSPISHNQNGLVGKSTEELHSHLRYLLDHPGEADRLGQAARETVANQFSSKKFVALWRKELAQAAQLKEATIGVAP